MDRPQLFLEVSRSLCPRCRRVIDGQVLVRDGKVILRKRCPEHGFSEALLSSDADYYLDSLRFNRPGTLPKTFATEVRDGCPYDCGLCPEHQQHTCLAILEITSGCNLRCPICFTSAGDVPVYRLSLEQVEGMLDSLERREGFTEVVQISGGEPTVHPRLEDILRAVRRRPVRHLMLNTNGLRLARDEELVGLLAELEVVVYFQLDGLDEDTHLRLRGQEDLLDTKLRALECLAQAGVDVVLVATVVRGVNDQQLGRLLDFGLGHAAVRGINYQPVFLEGRHLPQDPLERWTVPDVIRAVAAQSRAGFEPADFHPIPCCHPSCMAALYAYIRPDGRATPIGRLVRVEDYLDYFANRPLPDLEGSVRRALEGLYSSSSVGGSLKQILDFCQACGIRLPPDLGDLERSIFAVQVTQFMDVHNFELKRLMKCCVHQLLPDGRLVPFCAYNTIGYRERVTAAMTAGP